MTTFLVVIKSARLSVPHRKCGRVMQEFAPRQEGVGNAGRPVAPAALRAENKARKQVTAGKPETSGIPAREWF